MTGKDLHRAGHHDLGEIGTEHDQASDHTRVEGAQSGNLCPLLHGDYFLVLNPRGGQTSPGTPDQSSLSIGGLKSQQ